MRSILLSALFLLALSASPAAASGPGQPPPVPLYRLDVSLDIPASKVSGTVSMPVLAGRSYDVNTGTLKVAGVNLNGRPLPLFSRDGRLTVSPPEPGTVDIRYEGVFRGGETVGDRNYGVVSSTIDSRGVSLTGTWYPRPSDYGAWKVTALLPSGYEAVSEAESITREQRDDRVLFTFDFPHAADGLSLVATDRYEVTRDRHGSVELYAYFLREDRELAKPYLQAVKKYLDLYEKMLTPFPYRRFSVVENFLSTGYSLPTFTLLGQDVVRLPFITETSLGHEVLHQWFGCSVYLDEARGNWAEGLTTYLADHWYEQQKGAGWEYRKQLLVNYAAYVNGKNEFPLRAFRSRVDHASRAIGYGKSAMVFHMLRSAIGDEAFFGALRDIAGTHRFREASWDDLAAAFATRSGRDLTAFFGQWLDGTGLPEVTVEAAAIRRKGGRFEISMTLGRKNSTVPVDLGFVVSFHDGSTQRDTVTLDGDRKTVTLLVDGEPSTVVIDGDYDVARRPIPDEIPPVIATLVGEERPLVVLPVSGRERYARVIEEFTKRGGEERDGASLTEKDMRSSSLVVLGKDNPAAARLFGGPGTAEGGFSIRVRRNPWNSGKVAAVIHSTSAAETEAAFEKIFHYGKYSRLAFDRGRNAGKQVDAAERGLIIVLREEPVVLDLGLLRKFSAVVDGAADKRIVYIGEYHDRFSHHNIQLQLVKALYAKDPKLAVGMEMFQRPFQGALDRYIAGEIDEQEFLRQSEYFGRWGFDYNLYKPLLDFCRERKVPVIALNLRKEITEKVAKGGTDPLSPEERRELPRETDLSDAAYRTRIRQAFDQHKGKKEKDFDFFLMAQVLWDETMAESIDDYLRGNPDRRMAVIAGGGHVVHGGGIPKRAFRRNGLPYLIVVNDLDVEPGLADYVIYPPSLEGMAAPRLLATFREQDKRLIFNDFVNDSPAKAAGIRAGDALIALDGAPVSTIQDVKLKLFTKNKGDSLLVTVARQRFLLGEKVMTVEVKL